MDRPAREIERNPVIEDQKFIQCVAKIWRCSCNVEEIGIGEGDHKLIMVRNGIVDMGRDGYGSRCLDIVVL